MLIPIKILSESLQVPAQVIYNFQQIANVILIIPLALTRKLNGDLLFIERQEKYWQELTRFSTVNPQGFEKLARDLMEIFLKKNFPFFLQKKCQVSVSKHHEKVSVNSST